jgi:nitroreductase
MRKFESIKTFLPAVAVAIFILASSGIKAVAADPQAVDATSSSSINESNNGSGASKYAKLNGVFGRLESRNFSSKAVTADELNLLLNAAFASPTGGNQHAIELMLVTDRSKMKVIQEGHPHSKALDTAPLVIVIAENTKTAKYPELSALDAGIAAMSIMVEAADLGLQTVPMSIKPQKERIDAVAKALGNPPEAIPQIMIAIGHSDVDTNTHASTNYFNASQVHTNKW